MNAEQPSPTQRVEQIRDLIARSMDNIPPSSVALVSLASELAIELEAAQKDLEKRAIRDDGQCDLIANLRQQLAGKSDSFEKSHAIYEATHSICVDLREEISNLKEQLAAKTRECEEYCRHLQDAIKSVLDARDLLSPDTNLSLEDAAKQLRAENAELKKDKERYEQAIKTFIDRCERGEVRSTKSYNAMLLALNPAAMQPKEGK